MLPHMTSLSTHVLDTASGQPARGLTLSLWQGDALLYEGTTNDDGRCPAMGEGRSLATGTYRLEFHVADYFRGAGRRAARSAVPRHRLDRLRRRRASGHYHVPLLVSPFGYSTYRGS